MSKLSVHCQGIPPFGQRFVADSGVEYIKLIDPPENNPFPGVKIIGRTYMPDGEANAMIAKGSIGGEEWFNKWLPIYQSRPYVYAWEFINEPQPMGDRAFRLAYNDALITWSGLMGDYGFKSVGGCFGVGWPDVGTAADVGLGLEMCDLWEVHEYSAPTLLDRETWHCLRYRRTVAELRAAGFKIKPLIIGECGIDGGVEPVYRPKTGWKTFVSEDEYLSELKWYDSELMKDDYVEAATIFTAGPNDEWMDFEVTESLANKLAAYIASTPNPAPKEKARGIDVSKYQGDINWELVKADGYVFVMIRASGPNDDRTAVVTDPRFAANYDGAGSVGMLRMAYHGMQDVFEGQSRLFVDSVGGRPLELGYASDLEILSIADEKCDRHLLKVDELVAELLGVPVTRSTKVYTNPNFMSVHSTFWAVDRELWLAHWTEENNIIVPAPWTTWKFWQHGVGDAGTVSGISTRIDLDVYNGTVQELYDEYGIDDDDDDDGVGDMIEVVDLKGNPIENGWADAVARGARLFEATPPEGATVWRVKRLVLDTGGSMAFRMYAKDENGAPIPGVVIFEGWKDPNEAYKLPDDAAPRMSEDHWGQPDDLDGTPLPNTVFKLNDQFTNADGFVEWLWGPGEFVNANEIVHWGWVMPGDNKDFSDVFVIPGWWAEHIKYWVEFEKSVGTDDGGGEEPGDGDYSEVLDRIAVSLEYMVAHWPYK